MIRRSLSFVVCCSFLVSGGLMSMGTDAATKKVDVEKQKKLELLRGRVTVNEKVLEQIQALAETMDKGAAANICIREQQKLFDRVPEAIRSDINDFFEQFVTCLKDSSKSESLFENFLAALASKSVKLVSNNIKESICAEICTFMLYPEIGSAFFDIFFKTYIERLSVDMNLVFEKTKESEIVEKGAIVLADSFVAVFKNSIKVALQAMANELAKHYEIDFKTLGLEEPTE
jgi:hypothetical protein